MYFIYILYSNKQDKYYIGHTSDLVGRLGRHNSNHKGWTGKTSDWEVIYTEEYKTKSEAYYRERQLKAWKSRKRIEALIKTSSSN